MEATATLLDLISLTRRYSAKSPHQVCLSPSPKSPPTLIFGFRGHFGYDRRILQASRSQTPSPSLVSTLRFIFIFYLFADRAVLSFMDCGEASSKSDLRCQWQFLGDPHMSLNVVLKYHNSQTSAKIRRWPIDYDPVLVNVPRRLRTVGPHEWFMEHLYIIFRVSTYPLISSL